MQNKSQREFKNNYIAAQNEKEEKMNCKDGFCFLPENDSAKSVSNKSLNIFDPI